MPTRHAGGSGRHPQEASAGAAPERSTIPTVPTMTRREYQAEIEARRREEARRSRRRRRATITVHLPRAGIIGVLGLATVVAPLTNGGLTSGHLLDAAAATDGPSEQAPQPPDSPGPAAPEAVGDFRVIPEAEAAAGELLRSGTGESLAVEQLTAIRVEAERASRELARPALPGCDGVVRDAGAENGRLDINDMCALWEPGDYLRADAALALAELNAAYQQQFGGPLVLTDSYRSYEQQVSVRARKPSLAAPAGTSEHGWGLAVDLGGGIETADQHYQWMRENAPRFGWDNPEWARSGGGGPYEPWHWEYVAGQPAVQG